jgi:hypothetical protein
LDINTNRGKHRGWQSQQNLYGNHEQLFTL